MTYNLTCRLHSIIPCFRRSLWQNHYFTMKENFQSRNFTTDFPSKYHEDKYGELRKRLASIPYKMLLDKEIDEIQHEFCHEDDSRKEDILKWCSKVFDYNVRTVRRVHAGALLKAYCTYGFGMDDTTWDHWDSENWRSAAILAWCVEMLLVHTTLIDDVLDQSISRRGQPCWYKKENVGLMSFNDSILVLTGVFKVLKRRFATSKIHMNLMNEFLQAAQETAYGQCLDMGVAMTRTPTFDEYNFENYQFLSECKSGGCYQLPIILAMHLAGGYSSEEFEFTRKLCRKIVFYFQSQDDRTDCFGNEQYTGMLGNDIRDRKMSWFSIKFLEEASEPMKKKFMENYGVKNKQAIEEVIRLYKDTNLPEKFQEFEEQFYLELNALIESKNDIKGALFHDLFYELRNRKI